MKRKRTQTVYSKAKGSDVAIGVEICEWVKQDGKDEGRVRLRFFIQDGSKETFRFIAEPKEAYGLHLKMNRVVRSEGPCKEQTAPHKTTREEGGKKLEVISSVAVEKWVNGSKSGHAIVGSRSVNGKAESFNISVPLVEDFLFYAEFLKSLSISQSWEELHD